MAVSVPAHYDGSLTVVTLSETFFRFLDGMKQARVLCLGDVMLDHFVYGDVSRISPEAPVPVFRIQNETLMLGGAGNVARNLSALGARSVFVAAVGDDNPGHNIASLLAAEEGVESRLQVLLGRRTTEKTRYVAGVQQLLRTDIEEIHDLDPRAEQRVLEVVEAALDECQVVTLSDYGKGLLTDHVLTSVLRMAEARGIPTIVDPKGRDYSKYRGAFMVTPNRAELAEATGMKGATDEAIVAAARKLMDSSGIRNVLVTRSQDGMTLVTEAGDVHHIPARAREVFDVSGAGDTVVATMAAALAVHNEPLDAARLANLAGGIVVGKIGTATATAAELRAAATTLSGDYGYGKIMKLEHVEEAISGWKAQGLTVGFTNGCFDLLHPGHISLLRQARSHCDKLIVGLNSDASVSRLKGPSRPIQKQDARAQVLAALQDVDAVVVFDEDTPMRLITALLPDVLVKGADYTVETVVGADLVAAAGGRVVLAQLEAGFSTTQTVASISGSEIK